MSTNEILPQSTYDPEYAASSTPLLNHPHTAVSSTGQRWTVKLFASIFISTILVVSIFFLNVNQVQEPHGGSGRLNEHGDKQRKVAPESLTPSSRGLSHGVSEKAFRGGKVGQVTYPWTNSMLSWQRTSYHFQPEKNWMNDPNGPLFHMGWYHFFYQYNPDSAIWGNITWGHAVSTDLINWLHLPFAMVPDRSFDINGVFTGSATILPDGRIVMLYTGANNQSAQVQNLAYPKNLSDPLLVEWVKYPNNPVIKPPRGIGLQDFRDPSTAWVGPNGEWLLTIGSKNINKDGIALVYETTNFTSFKLLGRKLHRVKGTGMWECVDFYPISTVDSNGLDTSANGPNIKHVLKASMDDNRHDYYAIGTYNPKKNKWTPDNKAMDVGKGLRLDYGTFYASKTFYDHHKQRRVLWGWASECDSEIDDLLKGWASLQTIPRTIVFDKKTGTNILQWPVEEIESLRSGSTEFNDVKLEPGSIVPLKVDSTTQVDIVASFKVDEEALKTNFDTNVGYTCDSSGGSVSRGRLGPFGLVVVADESLTELTPIYFYIAKGRKKKHEIHFCADELRSSLAFEVGKEVHGSKVPVLEGEDLTMRVLVDHSIVESYAQGGRTVITSRIYPTKAVNGAAKIFLFNNATGISVTASLKIWNMTCADIRNFPMN